MNASNPESTITAELLAGDGLSLSEAARLFPAFRQGKPVVTSTVFRWIMDGVSLGGGRRLRLEARRVGGRWLTTRQAIHRYIDAQTPTFDDAAPAPLPRTPNKRAKASERAAKQLNNLGI